MSVSAFFENTNNPCQPYLKSYPERKIESKKRAFNSDWCKYKWLEYCQELAACFCFACRVFLPHSKENTFRNTGFKDWKHANEKDKGLVKHNGSGSHNNAMKLWMERTQREKKHHTIQDSVTQVNLDQKQWLFAVFNVIRYLAANGMPLRGDKETEIKTGDGIFLRAFSQLLFNLDPKLMEIHKKLPGNAKCTSPDVQNEVISILANLIKNKIANDIRNAKLFTIMADGTTDKNRKEIQRLGVSLHVI